MCRVLVQDFGAHNLECSVQVGGFGVHDAGCGVQGAGFWEEGFENVWGPETQYFGLQVQGSNLTVQG